MEPVVGSKKYEAVVGSALLVTSTCAPTAFYKKHRTVRAITYSNATTNVGLKSRILPNMFIYLINHFLNYNLYV